MTMFVWVAAALSLLTAALMTRPLWWPSRASTPPTLPDTGRETPRTSVGLAAVLAVFVFAVAGGGYALLGAPDRLSLGPESSAKAEGSQDAQSPADAASYQAALAKINGMVEQLVAHLKAQPDDADGWQLLARTYATMGQQAPAIEAFKKAVQLRPEDSTLLSDYAVALAIANNRDIDGEPMQLVERALKANPKNPKALALAGTAAFSRKDYKGAVAYWEELAKIEPADTPFGEQIRGSIAQARERAGMPPATAATAATATTAATAATAGAAGAGVKATAQAAKPAASGPAQVSGTVTLASRLKNQASPDDTVFIFARAVDGPRMPLAIIRKQVKDLPIQFTLDDSMAMSPAAKLSGVAQVVVGARISKSGNAMPQNGDLQGLVSAVPVGANGVKVEIAEQISR